jgi:hypothetical protein
MTEDDVMRLLLARRDSYKISEIQHISGHKYEIVMEGKHYNVVVLPSSFAFYEKRYHLAKRMPTLVLTFTHDTILPVACLSMDDSHLAKPLDLPAKIKNMDLQRHKSKYGSQVVLGGFIAGERNAVQLVSELPPRSRRRYIERAKELGKRRRGRPVSIAS